MDQESRGGSETSFDSSSLTLWSINGSDRLTMEKTVSKRRREDEEMHVARHAERQRVRRLVIP